MDEKGPKILSIDDALNSLERNPQVSASVVQAIRSMCKTHAKNPDDSICQHSTNQSIHSGVRSENSTNVIKDASLNSGTTKNSRCKQQLPPETVLQIFQERPKLNPEEAYRRGSLLLCKSIAPKYGVTPKTVRDIWRGRTWSQVTMGEWTEHEKAQQVRRRDDESDTEPAITAHNHNVTVAFSRSPSAVSCDQNEGALRRDEEQLLRLVRPRASDVGPQCKQAERLRHAGGDSSDRDDGALDSGVEGDLGLSISYDDHFSSSATATRQCPWSGDRSQVLDVISRGSCFGGGGDGGGREWVCMQAHRGAAGGARTATSAAQAAWSAAASRGHPAGGAVWLPDLAPFDDPNHPDAHRPTGCIPRHPLPWFPAAAAESVGEHRLGQASSGTRRSTPTTEEGKGLAIGGSDGVVSAWQKGPVVLEGPALAGQHKSRVSDVGRIRTRPLAALAGQAGQKGSDARDTRGEAATSDRGWGAERIMRDGGWAAERTVRDGGWAAERTGFAARGSHDSDAWGGTARCGAERDGDETVLPPIQLLLGPWSRPQDAPPPPKEGPPPPARWMRPL